MKKKQAQHTREQNSRRFQDQRGSVLLLSLLIMASTLTAASSFGIITIQNLRQSGSVDNGIRAYYAAESAVEDGLYEIRKNLTAVSGMAPTGSLSNGGAWSRSITTTVNQITSSISENDFIYLDLYDPDDSLVSKNIKQLVLTWSGAGSWLEVQIAPWKGSLWTDSNLGAPTAQVYSVTQSPKTVTLNSLNSLLYRVRLKALYADIDAITVSAKDESGADAPIPAQITMYGTGEFSRANQVVRATMPQRSPLSGVADYVLFIEEDLIK